MPVFTRCCADALIAKTAATCGHSVPQVRGLDNALAAAIADTAIRKRSDRPFCAVQDSPPSEALAGQVRKPAPASAGMGSVDCHLKMLRASRILCADAGYTIDQIEGNCAQAIECCPRGMGT